MRLYSTSHSYLYYYLIVLKDDTQPSISRGTETRSGRLVLAFRLHINLRPHISYSHIIPDSRHVSISVFIYSLLCSLRA